MLLSELNVTVCYAYDPWQPMWVRSKPLNNWQLIDEVEQRFTLPVSTYSFDLCWDNRVFAFDLRDHHYAESNPLEWLDLDFWWQVDPQAYHVKYEIIQDATVYREEEDMVYTIPEPSGLGLLAFGLCRRRGY